MANWGRYYGGVFNDAAEQARAAYFHSLTEPVALEWIYGLHFILQPGENISRAVCISGYYEPNSLLALQDYLKPGDVFIDAGANVGIYSLVAARLVGPEGRVIAFEPSPREMRRLAANIGINQLQNVTLRETALGDSSGTAQMNLADKDFSGLNTLAGRFVYANTPPQGACTVKVARLDDEVKALNLSRLDMMKIDVEGWETQVILGAQATLGRLRPLLLIEIVQSGLKAAGSSAQVLEYWLRSLDYAFFRIDDQTGQRIALAGLNSCNEENVLAVPREHQRALGL